MESSQPLTIELSADAGLECQLMGVYLDRLTHLAGKLKTLEAAMAELYAQLSSINETVKDLQRSLE